MNRLHRKLYWKNIHPVWHLHVNNLFKLKFPPKKLQFVKYVRVFFAAELCAGIVDKSKSLIEIAHEEIVEECGYNVPIERIELVMSYRSGVGSNGSMQTLYYCEVTDADKVNSGGGIDDEIIEVFELTLDECREMLKQGSTNNAPPSCLFGISWFLANKEAK